MRIGCRLKATATTTLIVMVPGVNFCDPTLDEASIFD